VPVCSSLTPCDIFEVWLPHIEVWLPHIEVWLSLGLCQNVDIIGDVIGLSVMPTYHRFPKILASLNIWHSRVLNVVCSKVRQERLNFYL